LTAALTGSLCGEGEATATDDSSFGCVETTSAFSVAALTAALVGSVAIAESAAIASSLCPGINRLDAPIEIANPIMAADLRARRLTSVEVGLNEPEAPTACFVPLQFSRNASLPAALSASQEGTDLTFCLDSLFKNDLLLMTSA